MASLAGRVISITGAASGMGNAFARLAAARGAKLALADIQRKPLEEFASELRASGTEAQASIVDVSSQHEVDDWIQGTVKHFGRLDSAANIAGILQEQQMFVDTSNEVWDRVLGVNLYGVMHCVRAQLRVMERGASIVNYSSTLGTSAQPGLTVYSISKHGIVGLTRGVAREVGGKGIRINAIAPGPIDTPLSRQGATPEIKAMVESVIPLGRWGQADDVAKLTAFLLSDESSFIHGHVHYIDGGLNC